MRAIARDCSAVEVRAQPGAKRSGLVGTWNGRLKIAVRAPAEDGRANEELASVLADLLGLRPRDLVLARGASGRLKEFQVALAADVVRARLRERLPIG